MPIIQWTEEELLLALALYKVLPHNLHVKTNPVVIEVADALGRTPGAVAMRLGNYLACDPVALSEGLTGLTNGLSVCLPVWYDWATDDKSLILREFGYIELKGLSVPHFYELLKNELIRIM